MIQFVKVNIWNTVACAKGKYESLPEQSFLFKSPNANVFCLFLEVDSSKSSRMERSLPLSVPISLLLATP